MRTPTPLHRSLAALATLPLAAAVLTGCGSDDGSPSSSADDSSFSGGVSGTPEEWLHAVCGDEAKVSSGDDPEARYGKHATESYFCGDALDGGNTDTYPEVALFDEDPERLFPSRYAEGYFTYAVGQVDEDQWAVVFEDSSTHKIDQPHLAPLGELGFDVRENERQG